MKLRTIATWTLRLGLATLFALAGVLKIRDPSRFALEIANYQLAPGWAPYLAIALPALEIVTAVVVLATPAPWRRSGALVMLGMLAMFTVAVSSALARGVNIDCGCFGGGEGPIGALTVVRNLALLAAAAALFVLDRPTSARHA